MSHVTAGEKVTAIVHAGNARRVRVSPYAAVARRRVEPGLTIKTGQLAWRRTRSATLPRNADATRPRPWVPSTMRSIAWRLAYLRISSAGTPTLASVVIRRVACGNRWVAAISARRPPPQASARSRS